ncbi:MAG: aspartyl-tRNA synthetase [Candidatus Omnitrophota bacterium]|jgi:aspartyl-tRNA synthetase
MLRTHKNNELNPSHLNQEVKLCGWVAKMRDHGGVNFVDLRDRWGVTQVVFNPELNLEVHALSQSLRSEFCVQVSGFVRPRPEGTVNPNLPTGAIELEANQMTIFSKSKTPPFEIDSQDTLSEDIRLKYRYLDLRRNEMQKNLLFRNDFLFAVRQYLQDQEFVELETPILTKSTPEGARDYLVPSRVHPGEFFALPQSPQLFKQLLMVSGFDRYFQIAKCFRDEDLRADRQPEFTQIDVEMTFVSEEDIYAMTEKMVEQVYERVLKKKLTLPFKRISHKDAISRYGSDKPDTRFDLELKCVTSVFKSASLRIFKDTVENGGSIIALHLVQPKVNLSRKDYDSLIQVAKDNGAGGLAYIKVTEAGFESPIAKFFSDEEKEALANVLPNELVAGDVIFFAADVTSVAQHVLGQIRLELARRLELIDPSDFDWIWVTDFPLFKFESNTNSWTSEHHPFTSPHPDDVDKIGVDNANIRSLSYDLVLNGNEIASGSVRIHDAVMQQKIFDTIGLSKEESAERFSFLLKAFEYGPPPHAGIALGVDRLVALFMNCDSIREVIAFPKTQKASCPLTDAPSAVDSKQLRDLGVKLS